MFCLFRASIPPGPHILERQFGPIDPMVANPIENNHQLLTVQLDRPYRIIGRYGVALCFSCHGSRKKITIFVRVAGVILRGCPFYYPGVHRPALNPLASLWAIFSNMSPYFANSSVNGPYNTRFLWVYSFMALFSFVLWVLIPPGQFHAVKSQTS